MPAKNYVVPIGASADPSLVGGKGASLTRMLELGLTVPPGVTITTNAWRAWRAGKLSIKTLYTSYVKPALAAVLPPIDSGHCVSVRSGAAVSMPGMMETILWVGSSGSDMYFSYLMSRIKAAGLDMSVVEDVLDKQRLVSGKFLISYLGSSDAMRQLEKYAGIKPDADVDHALLDAIELVFNSWDSDKARAYRAATGIPDDLGTACTIQQMVDASTGYGGLSGVMLTRGEIEWLSGEQGDAVVDGIRKTNNRSGLLDRRPTIYQQLVDIGAKLERAYHDAMDVEFTYDGLNKKLNILQCRPVKRTPIERMRLAVELYQDGIVPPRYVLDTPIVDDSEQVTEVDGNAKLIAQGVPINGKLLTGRLRLGNIKRIGKQSIVVRTMTTTDDIEIMRKAGAVISLMGGPVCHAALVARELGTTAIVGAGGTIIKNPLTWLRGPEEIRSGQVVTITPDGRVYLGKVGLTTKTVPGKYSGQLQKLQAELTQQIAAGKLDPDVARIDLK